MSTPFPAAELVTSTPAQLAEHTSAAIADARAGVAAFLAHDSADVPATLDLLDEAKAAIDNARAVATTVRMVHPDEAMRDTAEEADQELNRVLTEIMLDRNVFEALAGISGRLADADADADAATRHWVSRLLRDMRLAGVDRDEATRVKVGVLREQLVAREQEFLRVIAADSRAMNVPPEALAGLPEDYRKAHPPGDDGMVRISTDYPDLLPFMAYADDEAAREQLFRLNLQRGNPENITVLRELLTLRQELAQLLDYPTWAAYATADKMIGTADAAADFIQQVADAARRQGDADYADMLERKRRDHPEATAVQPWDLSYLTEKLKLERFAFDSQAARSYFEYHRVKDGLLALTGQLFGIEFQRRTDIAVWHPEVEAYDVTEDGQPIGRIFLDMHPRPGKFTHAAMFSIVKGKKGVRAPECTLVCNFPRPGAQPALLQPTNVATFLHEFGHLIHHLLAGQNRWSGVSGVSTEWDFVEAPSQMLEEWVQDAKTLATFAMHHETGEPIDAETVQRMRAADAVCRGVHILRQVGYAELSLQLHQHDPATLDLVDVERASLESYTPFKYAEGTYHHLSFGHLTGYSAVYYTYLWSLVIAKDLFTAFDQDDLGAPETAARYRQLVLAPGGSAPAALLVRSFLGRDFSFAAFRDWLEGQ